MRISTLLAPLVLSGLSFSCETKPPEPPPMAQAEAPVEKYEAASASPTPLTQTAQQPPKARPAPGSDDPLGGKFSLEEATKGLAGNGSLVAEITTELGKLECRLFDDKAPITVANFVGLARGLRPFKNPSGEWVKKNAYDGTAFHRVIKGFMIQGGDPAGTGGGEPGYVIPDEVWSGAAHDRRGLMCMANRGPNTNGMQFFITDAAAPHLDRSYTIFGECGPATVIEKLANVEVRGDRAVNPTKMQKVTVRRKPAK